ncbi:MAG: hypothetical protein ACK5ZP_14595 [Betaproteobacteria bacterium]
MNKDPEPRAAAGSPAARRLCAWIAALTLPWPSATALAWVYPEHRDIAVVAVQSLEPARRATLEGLWATARSGQEARLCAQAAEAAQGRRPACIDFAALPAIAGDHACSPREMLDSVLGTDWVLRVADVSAKLKDKLASAKRRNDRVNAIRNADIELQRADREYATRAGANNVHFLLPRPAPDTSLEEYGRLLLDQGAELNAVGAYAWFHLRALRKAARSTASQDAAARQQLALAALADEAFALHFLQDAFAAGHVAGSWGNVASRKGTHDYYNERGLETVTFSGERVVLLGDAHMRPEDANRAAATVRASLEQLLDAVQGLGIRDPDLENNSTALPDGFDVCREARFPARVAPTETLRALQPVLAQLPLPALAAGLGELPRFRAEIGPFIGMSAGARAGTVYGGFGAAQTDVGGTGGLDLAVRAGVGLDGVLNESGDGLMFAELGIRQDAVARTLVCVQSPSCATSGAASNVVPSRSALSLRLRAPFGLVPGDLVLAAPVLALAAPKALERMAVQAANGGLVPWQSGMSSPIGRFQFVLGREVGLSLYGMRGEDMVAVPGGGRNVEVHLRSLQVEFPVLEYRPFRSFSQDQSSGLLVQLFVAFDRPLHRETVQAGESLPELRTIPMVGVRMVFDWRKYLE